MLVIVKDCAALLTIQLYDFMFASQAAEKKAAAMRDAARQKAAEKKKKVMADAEAAAAAEAERLAAEQEAMDGGDYNDEL